ncbi:MAG: bifunctional acetate--CoA ligase family protein/GNAT family N-acetyltransferase [Rhodoferax sp.]
MSIRNLDSLFDPDSIAVFGASLRPGRLGTAVWHKLSAGHFQGALYAVNPKYRVLGAHPVVARARDLPTVPALAVICTPPDTVAALIKELAALGTRAAVVMTPGMSPAQKQAMLKGAQKYLLRILGPDCMGLLLPHRNLNVSLAAIDALPGELAFVSQSGALVNAMLDWAQGRGIGFSHFVALGEQADVDVGDMLDYLASDVKTRAILLYIESIASPRKFMSAARAAARNKPVLVVKAGRSAEGRLCSGARPGPDMVFDAAIARAGMLRVGTLQELFLEAQTLSRFRSNRDDTLTIVANCAAAALMAADAAVDADASMSQFSAATRQQLDAVLPRHGLHGNPIVMMADAPTTLYRQVLQILHDDPATGAVLLIHAPSAMLDSAELAEALVPLSQPPAGSPARLMSCWLGHNTVVQARQLFQDAGIADFDTPEQAVRAFSMLVRHRRNQAELTEAPPALLADRAPDTAAIRALLRVALDSGREWLTGQESLAVLKACQIPVVSTRQADATPEAAAAAALSIGFPVSLKLLSDGISHGADVGAVSINLPDEATVRKAAQALLERYRHEQPGAPIQGFTVQAMVRRLHAQQLIVGSTIDSIFGPVILFGHGGTAVELMNDRSVALPPLNLPLAKALVSRTRVARLLEGWGETPAADQPALHGVLVAVSQLLAEIPEVAELEINPLLLNFEGAIALEARIRLSTGAPAGSGNFAILPYPAHLEETVLWHGTALTLRPIRPEDEALHMAFLQQLDAEDIRKRIFYSRRTMERSELARLVQIDYAREMAFVAMAGGPDGQLQTVGVVRAMTDPDNVEAEFGVIVASALKGQGLGMLLMQKMIAYLRSQRTQRLVATVLDYNDRMLKLAAELGFEEEARGTEDAGTRKISLRLT